MNRKNDYQKEYDRVTRSGEKIDNEGIRKEHLKNYMRDYRRKQKEKIIELKGGCCQLCGYKGYLAAFDLHHPNGRQEGTTPNALLWKAGDLSFSKVKDQLDDLWLVCSNCHRGIHSNEAVPNEQLKLNL